MATARVLVCWVVLLTTGQAWATTELPSMFGGRSVGMGGTGVAFIHDATATYTNPATLDGIKTLSLVLDVSPFRPQMTAPLMGNGSFESTPAISPLFFVGGSYRLHERLVAGLAVYPTAGIGSAYEDVPVINGDMSMAISMIEMAVPVSVRVLDHLAVGVSWRGTYLMQTAKQPPAFIEQKLSGFNFTGFQLGAYYNPIPMLKLGLSYRSKITISESGETKVNAPPAGEMDLDTESEFSAPHSIRAGAALSLLDNNLLVAVDGRYLMYEESNKEMVVTITDPTGTEQTTVQDMSWKDTIAANIGADYKVTDMISARLGYSYMSSATPDENANVFTMPPGGVHGIHLGLGFAVSDFQVDMGFMYSVASKSVTPNAPSEPGTYKLTAMLGSMSATYGF